MIKNLDHQCLPEPKRYFDYAISFLKAGIDYCSKMIETPEEQTWSNASMVMLLEAHAAELFLKGAILVKAPDSRWLGADGHDLEALSSRYFELFSEENYNFRVPFIGSEYYGFSEEEILELKKLEKAQLPSKRFRYPVKAKNVEWNGIHGFIPEQSYETMNQLLGEMVRISNTIYPASA